ncbi:MAG: alpha/beta hydrolase [Pseudomonadales bacterium]
MMKLLAILVVGYALLVGAMYLLQNRLIFFPQPLWQAPQGPHVQPAAVERPGATLRGWIVNPESSGPLVIYFGGNAEELSTAVPTFARLNATTALINYRGFGASDGSPSLGQLTKDANAVVTTMHARWGADRPVILFGRSIGSGLAAQATRAAPVDGIILMSPFRTLGRVGQRHMPFLPVRWLLRDNIDITATIDALPDRILVLYGARDSIIPPEETLALTERLPPSARVVEYDGGHNVPLLEPEIRAAIEAFLADGG